MSNTVKIIVTLSEGQYEALKDVQFGGIGSRMMFNAVKHGIPLDSVKKEIDKAYEEFDGYDPSALDSFECKVFEILDNVGK